MLHIPRPSPADTAPYHAAYLAAAPGDHLAEALTLSATALQRTMSLVTPALAEHRYAPGKWSIKEVLQHVIDCERIFAYRALRCARNDGTPLPGFDENAYTPAANTARRALPDLIAEHDAVHLATRLLFDSFDEAAFGRKVEANGKPVGLPTLGWIIAGHAAHHARILDERYLHRSQHGSTEHPPVVR